MKWRAAAFLVGLTLLLHTGEGRSRRVKRRLDEFATMISVMTDRNPMDFNGYGNYCGLGGSGDTVDQIDECCKVHDECYTHVNRHECKSFLKYKVYTYQYRWQMHKSEIVCTNEGSDEICPKAICECDKAAATCFGKHKLVYNTENKHSAFVMGVTNGLSKLMG